MCELNLEDAHRWVEKLTDFSFYIDISFSMMLSYGNTDLKKETDSVFQLKLQRS